MIRVRVTWLTRPTSTRTFVLSTSKNDKNGTYEDVKKLGYHIEIKLNFPQKMSSAEGTAKNWQCSPMLMAFWLVAFPLSLNSLRPSNLQKLRRVLRFLQIHHSTLEVLL